MPRGEFRTTPGKLNSREAKEIANEIQAARPKLTVRPFHIAQGIYIIELREGGPKFQLWVIHNRQEWEKWQEEHRG